MTTQLFTGTLKARRLPAGALVFSFVLLLTTTLGLNLVGSARVYAESEDPTFSDIPSLEPIPEDAPSIEPTAEESDPSTVSPFTANSSGVCEEQYTGNNLAIKACEFGYDGQTAGLTKSQACGSFPSKVTKKSGSQKQCEKGWNLSKQGVVSGEDLAIKCGKKNCDFVGKYINPAIELFSLIFGLVAVISLILGGIQYSTSEGDPQKAAAAKKRIFNTVLAVVAYLFLYAFLQFLVPGGLFNRK
jgi:hypothetical protein